MNFSRPMMFHQRFEPPSVASNETLRLLHNELLSDVEFLVGPDGDTWRIAGHRDVLSENSAVFKAMLTGPLAHEDKVRIEDVDGRAFYQLLKVLYGGEPEKIRSERSCILTMYAANKYMCSKLFLHCVSAADKLLHPTNVLRIMQNVRIYVPDNMDVERVFSPSAPPMSDSSDAESVATTVDVATGTMEGEVREVVVAAAAAADEEARAAEAEDAPTAPSSPLLDKKNSWRLTAPPRRLSPAKSPRRKAIVRLGPSPVSRGQFPDPAVEANMGWYSAALYWNCLQFFDAYADEVLEGDCVEELPHHELVMLLRRGTMHIRREARVFDTLERWANRDCRRRGLIGSPENLRAAMGETLFLVRYLRMSVRELLESVRSGILDNFETAWLLGMAVGDPKKAHPDYIMDSHPPETLCPNAHLLAVLRPEARPCFIRLSTRCYPEVGSMVDQSTMTIWTWPPELPASEIKQQVMALKEIARLQKKEEKRRARAAQNARRKCTSGCFAEAFFAVLAFIFD